MIIEFIVVCQLFLQVFVIGRFFGRAFLDLNLLFEYVEPIQFFILFHLPRDKLLLVEQLIGSVVGNRLVLIRFLHFVGNYLRLL